VAASLLSVLEWQIGFALTALATLAVATGLSLYVPLLVLLVLAPLRTLVATEANWQFPLDIGQIAFLLFVFAYLAHHILYKKRFRLRLAPLHVALGVFLIATGITSITATEQIFWLTEWFKWVVVLALLLIIPQFAKPQWLIFSVIISACANALVGLYIFLGGSGADHLAIMGRFFRAFGTFGQPNPFGGFMGLVLPLALMSGYGVLARLWNRNRIMIRQTDIILLLFYGGASLLLLAALIASWSRGAWLGFIAAGVVMVFALPRRLWQSLALTGATIGILLLVWFTGLLPASITTRIASSTAEYFTLYDVRGVDISSANYAVVERLAHWQAALNMVDSRPWLGIGFGNYEVAYAEYRLVNWPEALGHAHNYYLNIWAEAGILGALAYIGLWLTVIVMTWRLREHPDPFTRAAIIGLLGSWTYLSVHSLLDNLYVNNLFVHIGILLVILVIYDQQLWSGKDWNQ
jgi:O-antigen ligase